MKNPDYLIIGAQKSGTTSLANTFNKHDELRCLPKEIHFFNHLWEKGPNWYRSLFEEDHELWGEKTPEYLYDFKCHERMKKVVPDTKLVIILRNPITRAFSAFHDYKNKDRAGYKDSVCGQVKDWDCYNIKKSFRVNVDIEIRNKFEKGFIRRGFYIEQIEHLLKFFSRNQIHISILEKVHKNPAVEYCKIYRFLGVTPIRHDSYPKANKGKYSKKLKPFLRKKLSKIFKPYNKKLFDFLGYKIKEWN